MGIPESLKRLREAAGLSQPALAKKAGVSQQLISQLENGKNATTKHLPKIARALGVTIREIDPSYDPGAINSDGVREELLAIYDRLAGHPDWQSYLRDQARQLESRVLGQEAQPAPKAATDR